MRGEVLKGNEYNSYCPVCQPAGTSNDKRLYYTYEGDKLLAHCKHGCNFEDIAKHFPRKNSTNNFITLREHIYYNADSTIFGKKVYRLINGEKQPCWKRFENGEYITGLQGKKAPIYNLAKLLESTPDIDVYIVEGEKDADTLTKSGLIAVSPPNGAGYWKQDFNCLFKGRNVIIIPDNDEVGQKHSEKVAKNLVKFCKTARILDLTDIYPELKKGGDVSDLFAELSNAKDLLLQLVSETESEQTRIRQICFITDDKGKPLKTFDNFKLLLNHHGISIKNNSITGLEFVGNLPKMTDENKENVSITYIYSLSREAGINFSEKEIGNYTIAEADANTYNPVKDWLNSLDKGHKGYIKKYFDCLIFDEEEKKNKEKYLMFFTKWLLQCIALQFNELSKPSGADGALGLQSQSEGIGKTSFFRRLCFEPRFFKDSVHIDPANKDDVRIACSVWISELGEVESTVNKDFQRLKAFITADYDKYRIPYIQNLTTRPRRTSFCFTCNSEHFLKDGDNRRFWTIPIIGVDLKNLKMIDIRDVWGEVYSLYLKKPQNYRLTIDERQFLRENNKEKFGFRTNEEEVLRDKLNFESDKTQWMYWTASDLSNAFFNDRNHARIIGKVLIERLGYTKNKDVLKHFRISNGIKTYNIPLVK